ncbi:MAG: hypothetical protein LBD45_04655 [Bacteroidales bacterium]|nr:hypothetical protein [Bacteroidales bacterium]
MCLRYKEYVLNGDFWERFTVIDKKVLTHALLASMVVESAVCKCDTFVHSHFDGLFG